MQGTQLGPYRLLSELGSGGMGTVHAAEVAESVAGLEAGQRVAVKVIHPHLLTTPGFFKRFLREAELGRKVVHENVVRTFDVDATELADKVVHYMAMEYVEGKSLRKLLLDLGTIPETLLREIALQTAAGLAAIHEAGIVHRDLKPENILITDDHEIRIMDLGVAKLQEASIAITKEGQFAGSVLYAAPEQFGPEEVGPSVDLYSLGVMLYELATGDNPFRRDDAAAVIEAQLKLQPPRITDLNTETTTFLAELVATLLAKKPADRFASAQVLHEVLAEAERSQWWTELAPKLRKKVAHLPKIRVRRETELHGRDGDLKTLNEAWERAKNGEGNTVFVEGEAGIGKTRLVDAFLRGLEDKDLHILYGSYPPSGGLGGISDAILDKFGEVMLAEALAPYLTVTPSLIPAFAALVKHESPPTGSEPLQGDALHAVCVHLMRALAEEKPLVWLIEDLHFAPKESLDLVLALARAVESRRVLLVASARPGVPDDELANFSRLENYQRVPLHRLGAREVVQLLEDAFKSEMLAQKLGGTIAYKSDGVPFFVHELIRGLKDGRLLSQRPDGTYVQTQQISDIEVPSAVKDLIEGRLRSVSKDERALLEIGAVQGFEFDPDLVARVAERKKVRVLQDLAEIERRTGVVRGAGRIYRFDQYQILELILAEISEVLREEYHSLLAGAFAAREGDAPAEDEHAFFLAWHHLHGSDPNAGLPHLTAALDYLSAGYRDDAAIALAQKALEAPERRRGAERVEVLLRLADLLRRTGRNDEREATLEEAVRLADATAEPALQAKARISLGFFRHDTGAYEEALVPVREALDLQHDEPEIECSAHQRLASTLVWLSRYDEAEEHTERAFALARQLEDRSRESSAHTARTLILYSAGRIEDARINAEQGLALNRELGDRVNEAVSSGNVGLFCHELGRYGEAKRHYESQRAIALEIGMRPTEVVCLDNLGRLYAYLGDEALGRKTLEESLALAREIGRKRSEGYALHRLGEVTEFLQEHEEAEKRYGEALAIRREIGYTRGVAETLAVLGRLLLGHGRTEEARQHLEEARNLARETGRFDPLVLSTAYLAALSGGDVRRAVDCFAAYENRLVHHDKMEARYVLWKVTGDVEHLRAAHGLLLFGRDHAPEEHRDSMIENVPLHRDIMRAWEEHGAGR
ncbi:MAG: serine/threonine-protein kinase [Planctomycetota bacterium]